MSDEIKKIDEISETQNAPEIKKEKKKLSKKAKKIIIIVVSEVLLPKIRQRHLTKQAGTAIGALNVTFTELRTAFGLSLTTGIPTE